MAVEAVAETGLVVALAAVRALHVAYIAPLPCVLASGGYLSLADGLVGGGVDVIRGGAVTYSEENNRAL
jgi:hypothetical protein